MVEAVVAIAVVGLCMGTATRLVLSAREMSGRARSHYTAVNIAKNRVERARTTAFEDVELMGEQRVVVNQHGTPEAGGQYRRTTVVTNLSAKLKEVCVTVDILDRVEWQFIGEGQAIRTYIADFVN